MRNYWQTWNSIQVQIISPICVCVQLRFISMHAYEYIFWRSMLWPHAYHKTIKIRLNLHSFNSSRRFLWLFEDKCCFDTGLSDLRHGSPLIHMCVYVYLCLTWLARAFCAKIAFPSNLTMGENIVHLLYMLFTQALSNKQSQTARSQTNSSFSCCAPSADHALIVPVAHRWLLMVQFVVHFVPFFFFGQNELVHKSYTHSCTYSRTRMAALFLWFIRKDLVEICIH